MFTVMYYGYVKNYGLMLNFSEDIEC